MGWRVNHSHTVIYCNILTNELLYRVYTLYSIYKHNICDCKLHDKWVNTALLQVIHSGLTGLKTRWALLTIAAWLSLLPSLAWLRLCLRVFSWANPSHRSCLIDWPRCSLLGQPQLEFSASAGLAWRSLTHLTESMNTGLCWLSLNTVLMEHSRPYLPKEAVSS